MCDATFCRSTNIAFTIPNTKFFHKGQNIPTYRRRKLRLIEGDAKGKKSLSKKLTCDGTLRYVFFCLKPRTPCPTPFTLYHPCIQYTYSHRVGGRGESRTREKGRCMDNSSQSWVENTNMTDCNSSLHSDKHLPQSPFTELHWCRYIYK